MDILFVCFPEGRMVLIRLLHAVFKRSCSGNPLNAAFKRTYQATKKPLWSLLPCAL